MKCYSFLLHLGEAKLEISRQQLKLLEDEKQIEMRKMSHLKELGVDLTAYLVSQYPTPDKHYKFDTTSGKDGSLNLRNSTELQTPIQVHLHE